jgi:hypothetical protein
LPRRGCKYITLYSANGTTIQALTTIPVLAREPAVPGPRRQQGAEISPVVCAGVFEFAERGIAPSPGGLLIIKKGQLINV